METTLTKNPASLNEIRTAVAARITGLSYRTLLKYRHLGKLAARRESDAPQAPWLFQRDQIMPLKRE